MALCERLRKLRENKELKQIEAAAALGISSVNLNRYETGKHSPDLETLTKLALFYGVTTDYLLGRVSSPTDELVPITTEPLDPSATYMNDPASDEINDLLTLMSPEEKEAFRRLAQSVVNRQTKDVG